MVTFTPSAVGRGRRRCGSPPTPRGARTASRSAVPAWCRPATASTRRSSAATDPTRSSGAPVPTSSRCSSGDDTFRGGSGNDRVCGASGDDEINGQAGATICEAARVTINSAATAQRRPLRAVRRRRPDRRRRGRRLQRRLGHRLCRPGLRNGDRHPVGPGRRTGRLGAPRGIDRWPSRPSTSSSPGSTRSGGARRRGTLELIVRRPGIEERELVDRAELELGGGWSATGGARAEARRPPAAGRTPRPR